MTGCRTYLRKPFVLFHIPAPLEVSVNNIIAVNKY